MVENTCTRLPARRVSSSPVCLWHAGTDEICGSLASGYHYHKSLGVRPGPVSVLVA